MSLLRRFWAWVWNLGASRDRVLDPAPAAKSYLRVIALAHIPELTMPKIGTVASGALQTDNLSTRETWRNYVGTQVAQPFEICRAESLDDLKNTVKRAAAMNCPVRAVGSGHSWSDAALTDGIVVETHQLDSVLELYPVTLKSPGDASSLIHVEAGITIQSLNAILDARGQALLNMGGFDGQTLAGVISTSTHGSGIGLGSFPSFVAALVVLAADGSVLQIEPTNGISDPGHFAEVYGTQRVLRQDDQLFNATIVAVGSAGIIYAAILRVTQKYWLSELRVLMPWSEIREKLDSGIVDEFRHVEVLINPYKIKGDNLCLLTTREMVPEPTGPVIPRPFRYVFGNFLSGLPGSSEVLTFLFNQFPRSTPDFLQSALQDLEDRNPYEDISYRIFNVGYANSLRAISAEFGIDFDLQIQAVEAILCSAEEFAAEGGYNSSPIALRWVAPSPGMVSMQPTPTCMIEMPMLADVFGSDAMLWRYENLLTRRFGARPHWGQQNFVSCSGDLLRKLYLQFDEWVSVVKTLDPGGVFSSRFTDRIGLTNHAPERVRRQ